MNIATVEMRTESRSVSIQIPAGYGHMITLSVGARRDVNLRGSTGSIADAEPWPPPTVYLHINEPMTRMQWRAIAEAIDMLFEEYARKFENVVVGKLEALSVDE